MNAFKLFYSDVTRQHSRLDAYDGQEIQTLVAQQDGPAGVADAQLLFAPGLASAPVQGDRLMVTRINSNLYAVGGASQGVEAALGLSPGERALFSTDTSGNLKSVIKLRADGSASIVATTLTVDGDLQVDGTVSVGTASDAAALATKVDLLWAAFYAMFSGWSPVPLDGGAALKTAFTTAFPAPPLPVGSNVLLTD